MNIAKLRGKMAEKGISQRKLAEITGIKVNTLNSRLTSRKRFTVDEIIKICDALCITDPVEKCQIFLSGCSESETK